MRTMRPVERHRAALARCDGPPAWSASRRQRSSAISGAQYAALAPTQTRHRTLLSRATENSSDSHPTMPSDSSCRTRSVASCDVP